MIRASTDQHVGPATVRNSWKNSSIDCDFPPEEYRQLEQLREVALTVPGNGHNNIIF